jgi:hypothetical protein
MQQAPTSFKFSSDVHDHVQVRTDFAAIPTEPSDSNYIDKWLEEQKIEYEKREEEGSFTKMLNIFRHIQSNQLRKN